MLLLLQKHRHYVDDQVAEQAKQFYLPKERRGYNLNHYAKCLIAWLLSSTNYISMSFLLRITIRLCKYLDFQASYSAESNDKCSKKTDSLSLMSCLRACFAGNVGMNPNHFPVYFSDVPAMTSHKRRVLLSNKAARVSPISTPLDCSWETALSTQSPYSFWMARQLNHKNCCVGNVQRI